MISKLLIVGGVVIILSGIIGIGGGIYYSFQAMQFSESAGIGAVGSGLLFALVSNILIFVGLAIMAVGLVKFYRERNRPK